MNYSEATQATVSAAEARKEIEAHCLYHLVFIRHDNGARTRLTSPPATHKEACTIKSKHTGHAHGTIHLEAV